MPMTQDRDEELSASKPARDWRRETDVIAIASCSQIGVGNAHVLRCQSRLYANAKWLQICCAHAGEILLHYAEHRSSAVC